MSTRTTHRLTRTRGDFRAMLTIAIEASWLAGLVLVPLVFRGREWVAFYSQPKYFLVHLVALVIVVAWTAEWALHRSTERSDGGVFDRIENWVGRDPGRWAVMALGGFALAAVASTLLSPLPRVSVWGRDFGDLGYELYSTLSFMVVLFAIAFRVRTRRQVIRLAMAVAGTGTMTAAYGLSQHFGWDPIGRGADLPRVISSFGNALFFGSYLVMTVTITVALGIYGHIEGRRWALPAAALATGMQLAALWLAGGRGPWVGTTVGLVAFIGMGWLWLERRLVLQATGVVAGAVLLAALIVAIPADAGRGERGIGDLFDVPGELADAVGFVISPSDSSTDGAVSPTAVTATVQPTPGATTTPDGKEADAVESTPGATTTPGGEEADAVSPFPVPRSTKVDDRAGALSGRARIWGTAIELAISRDRPFDESGVVRGLRILFGFGPDMFFYSYPAAADPQAKLFGVSHAHNYLLQVLMEEGLVGAALMAAAAVLLLISAVRVLRTKSVEPWLALLVLATLAALMGRAVDQFGSVARLSDLMLFFALAGTLFALTEVARARDSAKPGSVHTAPKRARRREQRTQLRLPALAVAAIVAALASFVFATKDVAMLRAGWIAANGFEQKASSDGDPAFRSFARAADLAPDVERYAFEQAVLLRRTANREQEPAEAARLLTLAHDVLARYESRDPHAWMTQRELAAITQQLVALGDTGRMPELIARYDTVAALMEAYPFVQADAAVAMARIGAGNRALAYADRAIAGEAATSPLSGAWWARGSVLLNLGQTEEAAQAFRTAIDRNSSPSYRRVAQRDLALILEASGDEEGAAQMRAKASK